MLDVGKGAQQLEGVFTWDFLLYSSFEFIFSM